MGEVLLTGVNHVAFATRDLKATTAFYSEVFDLAVTALGDGNALLLFPNGSFLQFIDGTEYPATERVQRDVGGALLYEGESIDHLALFASDSDALEIIRERLVARGASTGERIDTAGVATTVRFEDPDGRILEVTAYPVH